jgi:hypothetical protein
MFEPAAVNDDAVLELYLSPEASTFLEDPFVFD